MFLSNLAREIWLLYNNRTLFEILSLYNLPTILVKFAVERRTNSGENIQRGGAL